MSGEMLPLVVAKSTAMLIKWRNIAYDCLVLRSLEHLQDTSRRLKAEELSLVGEILWCNSEINVLDTLTYG
jgi:hypothetical protein